MLHLCDGVLTCTEYLETVGKTMDYFNPGCSSQVQQGFASLQSLVNSRDTATINSLFV